MEYINWLRAFRLAWAGIGKAYMTINEGVAPMNTTEWEWRWAKMWDRLGWFVYYDHLGIEQ